MQRRRLGGPTWTVMAPNGVTQASDQIIMIIVISHLHLNDILLRRQPSRQPSGRPTRRHGRRDGRLYMTDFFLLADLLAGHHVLIRGPF